MEALKHFLEKHLVVSDQDWMLISNRLTTAECKKGEILTAFRSVENRLYFILDGALRLFFETETKDITLNIGFPNAFMSSYTSYLTQKPSNFILEALTPCSFAYFSKSALNEIYELTSCGQELGRILTEQLFLYLSHREDSFLLKSPTQRYLDLFEEQPQLIREIPQKYLSSYIGITPQALSRIRAKI